MSTFVVVDGFHYADTTYFERTRPLRYTKSSKICLSPDNQFVYSISGTRIEASQRPIADQAVRKMLEYIMCSPSTLIDNAQSIFPDVRRQLGQTVSWTMLASTKSRTFSYVTFEDNSDRLYDTLGKPNPVGSGCDVLSGILMAGMNVEDAYRLLHDYDHATGTIPEKFDLSTLDDFVVLGQDTKG